MRCLHFLSITIIAYAILICLGITVPDRAVAQVTCPTTSGNYSGPNAVRVLRVRNASTTCTNITPTLRIAYDFPTIQSDEFILFLPDDAPVSGATKPVKVIVRNASATALNVTSIGCTGGATGGIGRPVATIGLPDGGSCELGILWNDGLNGVSFSGGTLSRSGNGYSITESVLAGGQFGGTTVMTIGQALNVRRKDGTSASDGDIDDLGAQTPGQEITQTYTICNTGTEELSGVNVGVGATQNLIGPNPVALVDITDNADLGQGRSMGIGKCIDFTAIFTPEQPADFSFVLNISSSANELFSLTVSGSASQTDDSGQVTRRTQRIIANFMGRRGAQIVAREPDLTKRLSDGGNSSRGGPVSVTGEGTANNNNVAFATSARQIAGSTRIAKRKRLGDAGAMMTLGARGDGGSLKDEPALGASAQPQTGFGLWAEGTWARIEDDSAKSDFGLLYVGADYRFNSGLVVGVIAQFDRMDETDSVNDFAIEGKGWMAGPYIVARLSSNLIFDARGAWGRSDNEVSPLQTYTDDFEGERWLVRSRLTGDFKFGALHVAPHVGVIYFEEEQKAYTDSNGNLIGAQTVELGRLTFGPKVSTSFTRPDGTTIAPFIAVQGIWDFKRTDQVDIDTGLAVIGTDKVRARAEAGLSVRLPQGVSVTGEGFYDGIGADGYNAYGGSLKVGLPF